MNGSTHAPYFMYNLLLNKYCWLTVALKGAATLKVRSGSRNRLNGGAPILPIEDNYDLDFDFEKGRLILAQGAELYVESPEGTFNAIITSPAPNAIILTYIY